MSEPGPVSRRATVHDVAAEAGVSLATVDRVLNGRKGVRAATIAQVRQAIDRLGYERDHFAASLATSRRHRFHFILPGQARNGPNTFMIQLREEVGRAATRLMRQRIAVTCQDYAPFDETALCEALDAAAQGCHGVAVVAIDTPAVREAIGRLIDRGVAVVTLVSDVTPSRRLHCIGINNIAAGRVAASLIGRFLSGRAGTIAVIAGTMTLHDHAERCLGFSQVIAAEFASLALLPPEEGRDDSRTTAPLLRKLLQDHDDLVGIYAIGAGTRGIAQALEESGRAREVVLVGHELTPHTRRGLIAGTFDAILHQDPADEVRAAINALRAAADGQSGHRPAPIRIDIFLRDNLL